MKRIACFLLLISLFLFSIFFIGCSQGESKSQKPSSSLGQKPETPSAAKEILNDINKIISNLDKKSKMQKIPQLAQSGQQQSGDEGQNGEKGSVQNSQDGEKSNKSGQGSSGSESGQKSQLSNWQEENTLVKNIHNNWNNLEPEAVQAGMNTTSRDGFKKALNELTIKISEQKLDYSLLAAIQLYHEFTNLAQIFSTPVPAGFFQVKYRIMAAMAEASRKNWPQAKEYMVTANQDWNDLRIQAKKADEKLINRSEFSIKDLAEAVDKQEMNLVAIKGEIAMQNLQKLEKELSKHSVQKNQ